MNERDELAEQRKLAGIIGPNQYSMDAADAVLAAGYRKPRTINTAEELDALPVGSVVANLDTGHVALKVWQSKHPRKDGSPLSEWKVTGDESEQGTSDIALPATVLHEGTQP